MINQHGYDAFSEWSCSINGGVVICFQCIICTVSAIFSEIKDFNVVAHERCVASIRVIALGGEVEDCGVEENVQVLNCQIGSDYFVRVAFLDKISHFDIVSGHKPSDLCSLIRLVSKKFSFYFPRAVKEF